ncbi:hypothetical protein Vadar_009427 [Vaccinium darrowii]|uniref:Uncharacterized protein n=1 Tax=Vaccinium darrowii TaxID=229202 RepID=A0ACB7YCV8_9ERIC|nr:hypothetical protein Vadar_009427 [Vaccinium darrowii]
MQEVEKFSPPQEKYFENDEGKTLQDVLTEEGEKWMKDAASSYSMVAALFATTMFAALFATTMFAASISMRGSINIDNCLPIFVKAYVVSSMLGLLFSVVVDEHCDGGISRNPLYDAAKVYLRTKISPDIRRFKVGKTPKQKSLDISAEKGEEIIDRFDNNLELKWRFISVKPQNQNGYENEKRFFELSFNNKYEARVLNEYLPFVLAKSKETKDNADDDSYGSGMKEHELGLVDSTTIISTMDFDAADNSAHLMREYQSRLAVSLSENKSGGEALKREFVTIESILGLVDLQQNSGGRRDDAAKSFGTIYDPGIHTTHSLAQISFEVLENPPMLEMLAIYPKLMGKISDLWKFVRGKNKEEKPLVEFDSTNNSAYQSELLVSNSEKTNLREESKRRCMMERVFGSVDSTTRILSSDFDAADNSAHLVRPYQRGPVVSLSGNENRGEASKRECITKRILGSEDLQQNSGGRYDNAAKSFGAIYDPGIHTTHSVAQNSFEVVEALPTWKQPNDSVPLLSLGRLTLEGCVQEEKSQDLPRIMQIDGVEQRVTKSPRYLEGFTAQSTSSSLWPIGLPDGRHIVVLNLLEQYTKNVAHVAMADQFSPTVPLPEKKMVRRTLKRKYRILNAIFLIHRQHFGKRCERIAKSFRAMRICRNHGINCVSMVKRIHKQHGINQWPFRQKWATRKGHSLGEKRPYEVSSLPMDLPRSLKLDCSGGLGAQSTVGLPDGGYVLSVLEKKIVGKTLKRKCKTMSLFSLEDDQQHAVKRWGDAAKSLGRKRICRQLVVQHVSIAKRIHRQHVFHRWPFQQNWETMKAYSVRDKRPAEVLSLSTDGKLVSRLQLVHISWLVKFLPRPSAYRGGGEILGPIALLSSEFAATNNRAHGIRKDQSGSSFASHSEEERPGEPKDVEGTGSGISLEELQKLFVMKREDAAKILKVSVSTLKRICRQHRIKPWPYQARKKGEGYPFLFHYILSNIVVILFIFLQAIKKPPDRHRGMNTTGSSDDWRNLSASQEDPLLRRHVSGPIYGASSTCTDPAPGQHMPIFPHPTENFLTSEEEDRLMRPVSGPIYATISSCTEPTPSQPTPIVPHPMEDLEDQRNLLTLPEEPLLTQITPTNATEMQLPLPTIDEFADWSVMAAYFDNPFPEGHASGSLDCTAPTYSNPAPSQTMPTNATEMRNMDFVELKATYDDATFGNTTIKFQLPPKFETSELEEKVSKILKCELDSFRVEYKDKDDEWILMGCDENVRDYLQLLNSLGNQVTKLKITKVPNTTNLCETCGSSLTRKRPRHV